MTRFLWLLFLVPTTLFAQIFTGFDMHGAVVQPRLAFTTTGAALAWNFRGVHVTMDVAHGPVYAGMQILLATDGYNPAIASDGENVLVVWTTDGARPRRPSLNASLVGRSGIIGAPFALAEVDTATAAAVGWNGTNYVIAWHDAHALGLRTTTVDRFGNFLGELHDVADTTPSYHVSIATDGDRSLVVTKDAFVVVDRDARPLAQRAGGGNDVVWTGSDYFVVDADSTGINGTHVSRDGVPLGPAKTLTSDKGHDPRVAWNGRDLEVLWLVDGGPFLPTVRFGTIAGDGTIPVSEEVWTDHWIDAENFDLAARPGQTIIARGPAALIAGTISFDIRTTRRRAAGN